MDEFRNKYHLLIGAYVDARKLLCASIRDESSINELLAYGEDVMASEPGIALRFFGRVLELDSKNISALVYSALCYWSAGDDVGFQKLLDRALKLAPEDPKVLELVDL
ncbi:hypothetical protein ACO0LL_03135 [Undibacterium sp. TC4M20W]|uniref:hypothetical protein n=1 Tax=unclassified Undibacterium TaxID=2630295 RepID=UPI003BF11D78